RPTSFSMVLFRGDVSKDIPKLLETCQYKIVESSAARTNFPDLYAKLPPPSGPMNSIVSKAYCTINGCTVLCEPEMVFINYSKELAQFCSEHSTEAVVVIWERVSETAALSQIS